VALFAIAATVVTVTIAVTRSVNQVTHVVTALAAILILLGIGRSARH
jgi:hypothetical protein